jgi:NAD(P) transhydrogenase subunit alpha
VGGQEIQIPAPLTTLRAGSVAKGVTRTGHAKIFGWWREMGSTLIDGLFVFMLAGFIGFEVIKRISPLLHTPLMSITNALDAIAVVGAIVLVGRHESRLSFILGILAVIAATSNIVGGFLITDRMLKMFKSSRPAKS